MVLILQEMVLLFIYRLFLNRCFNIYIVSIIDHTFYSPLPKYLIKRYDNYIKSNISKPLMYFNSSHDIKSIRKLIQSYITSNDDIVLVDNESDAINTILKSIPLNSNDSFLYLDISNPLVKDVLNYMESIKHFTKIELPIKLPSNKQDIIKQFEDILEKYSNITYAWIDHVSYQPSFILPIEEIYLLLNSRGIRTIIDGSLSVGQGAVNIAKLKPYIYTGTLKNSIYSMKSAFIYASFEAQEHLNPSVIYHYPPNSHFISKFDRYIEDKYPSHLTLLWGREVVDTLGANNIEKYNLELCKNITKYFKNRWNSTPVVPTDMTNSIISVELPCNKFKCENINLIEQKLRFEKNIWTTLFSHNGKYYSRLTCQIYNDEKEYINFADSIESIMKNVN